jgi:uncharacterized protein YkwD
VQGCGLLLSVAALLVLAAPGAAAPSGVSAADRCAASSAIDRETIRAIKREIRCLINAERARRNLAALRFQPALGRSARRHARAIVRRHYVSHQSGAGGPSNRAAGAGYMRGATNWTVGENIGWLRSVRDVAWIVRAWMRSPMHRYVLLHGSFRELGVGVVKSSPEGNSRGLTVVVDFGRRTLSRRFQHRRQRHTVAVFRQRAAG